MSIENVQLEQNSIKEINRSYFPQSYGFNNFEQYYDLHNNFVENLKKQAPKIQKLLQLNDRLKQDVNLKQKMILQLKKKENGFKTVLIENQSQIRSQYLAKIQLLQQKIRTKEIENQQLVFENQRLKSQLSNLSSINKFDKVFKIMHNSQNQTNNSYQLNKIKGILHNCKEQNNVLRMQLDNTVDIKNKLQSILQRTQRRIDKLVSNYDHKLEINQKQIVKRDRKITELLETIKNLQSRLQHFEGQTYQRISNYNEQIKIMIKGVKDAEIDAKQWEYKYYEIIQWILWIQNMRKQNVLLNNQNFLKQKIDLKNISQKIPKFETMFNSKLKTGLLSTIS